LKSSKVEKHIFEKCGSFGRNILVVLEEVPFFVCQLVGLQPISHSRQRQAHLCTGKEEILRKRQVRCCDSCDREGWGWSKYDDSKKGGGLFQYTGISKESKKEDNGKVKIKWDFL
jgi:hypothetical protein